LYDEEKARTQNRRQKYGRDVGETGERKNGKEIGDNRHPVIRVGQPRRKEKSKKSPLEDEALVDDREAQKEVFAPQGHCSSYSTSFRASILPKGKEER